MSAAPSALARFRLAYGAQRAAEGRAYARDELLRLPYLASGEPALVRQWTVRARTFDAFAQLLLAPLSRGAGRVPRVLDLGAGNGWLCWRATLAGYDAVAVDLRDDDVDGLGAARQFFDHSPARFPRIAASFEALPLHGGEFDVVVFNAALHYALDLRRALGEARRVARRGGHVAILDSPFYRRDAHGRAMVAEKQRTAHQQFGARADALMGLPFTEYLTRERLDAASSGLDLTWRRHRVRYPLWYEARPLLAWLRRRRPPSRFDLWHATVA